MACWTIPVAVLLVAAVLIPLTTVILSLHERLVPTAIDLEQLSYIVCDRMAFARPGGILIIESLRDTEAELRIVKNKRTREHLFVMTYTGAQNNVRKAEYVINNTLMSLRTDYCITIVNPQLLQIQLRLPTECSDLAVLVCRHCLHARDGVKDIKYRFAGRCEHWKRANKRLRNKRAWCAEQGVADE